MLNSGSEHFFLFGSLGLQRSAPEPPLGFGCGPDTGTIPFHGNVGSVGVGVGVGVGGALFGSWGFVRGGMGGVVLPPPVFGTGFDPFHQPVPVLGVGAIRGSNGSATGGLGARTGGTHGGSPPKKIRRP